MNWTQAIDAYCERTEPGLWAEPLNAVTNLAFLLVAVILWPRVRGLGVARVLCGVLALVGFASMLWHTLAVAWAGALDSASIAIFILIYLYAANRHYFGWSNLAAIVGALAFLPYAFALGSVFSWLPFFTISAGYWPVPVLIFIYAAILRGRASRTAAGLGLGALLLVISLTFRSLDAPYCQVWPAGTHFLWHILNAVMLGWMIEVLRVHMLAVGWAGR